MPGPGRGFALDSGNAAGENRIGNWGFASEPVALAWEGGGE